MSSTHNRHHHIVPAVLALVVAVGAYVGLAHLILGLQEERAVLKNEIGSQELQEEYIQSLHVLAQETREGRVELESYIVSRDNPARFLGALEEMGKDAGVALDIASLSESAVGEESSEASYGTIAVTYDIEGTWRNVYRFIRMIEHAPYALSVVSYTANRAAVDDMWEGRLTIEAHTKQ